MISSPALIEFYGYCLFCAFVQQILLKMYRDFHIKKESDMLLRLLSVDVQLATGHTLWDSEKSVLGMEK